MLALEVKFGYCFYHDPVHSLFLLGLLLSHTASNINANKPGLIFHIAVLYAYTLVYFSMESWGAVGIRKVL